MDNSINQEQQPKEEPPIILELNHFANLCGYFYNAYLSDNISANNGYNCSHPDQDEVHEDECSGKKVGCCYCWSCPLAYAAGAEELASYGVISREEAEESVVLGESHYEGDFEYVVVEDQATIAKLRQMGITGLAEQPKEDSE